MGVGQFLDDGKHYESLDKETLFVWFTPHNYIVKCLLLAIKRGSMLCQNHS